MEKLEFDFIVVGSGAGGAICALELAESGADVLLLDKGLFVKSEELPVDILDGLRMLWFAEGALITLGKVPIGILAGECVGGSTVMSGMILHRLPKSVIDDFSDSKKNNESSLTSLEIHDAELRALTIFNAGPGIDKNLIPKNSYFKESPLYQPMIRAIDGCLNTGRCLLGCPSLRKRSCLDLLQRSTTKNMVVRPTSDVESVWYRKDGVVGGVLVRSGNGSSMPYFARYGVVLGAGVLGTPRILQQSNIKNINIGKNFSSNLGSSALVFYPEDREFFEGAAMGLEAFHLLSSETPIKLAGQFAPDPYLLARIKDFSVLNHVLRSREKVGFWTSTFPSNASGSIHFPRFTKKPIIRFGMNERDIDNIENANTLIREECEKNGIVDFLSLTPRRHINVSSSHIFGGAVYGNSFLNSVVDMNLDVWGQQGLSIVDASVFPYALGVNPILSIATLSIAKARSLIRQYS